MELSSLNSSESEDPRPSLSSALFVVKGQEKDDQVAQHHACNQDVECPGDRDVVVIHMDQANIDD